MLKRSISGTIYVVILVAFFLLRQFVDYRLFDLLIAFFLTVGTIELANASKQYLLKGWYLIIIIYGLIFLPHYYLIEYIIMKGNGVWFALAISCLMIIVTAVYALIKKISCKRLLLNVLPFIYPALFLLTITLSNKFIGDVGFIALLLIFVITPVADTMAYLVGSLFSKLLKGNAKKLCPKLSPKKTWVGAIGGLIGGAIASLLVYLIFKPNLSLQYPIMFFIIVGIISSILAIIGDLFESFIKRKFGIKDMGKIMPGHGGILDRIDGTMFSSVFIYLVFIIL